MRAHFSWPIALIATLLGSWLPAQAQTAPALPGCEPAPEVRKTLEERLHGKAFDNMKFAEQVAFERQVLEGLMKKYPRELEPYRTLIQDTQSYRPDDFPPIRERFVEMAKTNPDDPLALLLGGYVLERKDTQESIRMLDEAKAKAPNFPWPSLALADLYFSGKRADKDKVAVNIAAFFAICPNSTDRTAQWLLTKNVTLQPKVAAALRARLEKETDPKRLRDYETLWGLEFRTRPPQQHDAERVQVAQDLQRLEALNPKGDAEWRVFLIKGYKESGASTETITAMEDRLLRDYPKSDEAYGIVSERWRKAHKEPEDQSDTAAWAKYDEAYKAALKGWIQDFPDNAFLQHEAWFYTIADDDKVPEKEGLAAFDQFLQAATDYDPPVFRFSILMDGADFLTQHRWEPERALDLVHQAQVFLAKDRARDLENDNVSDDDLKDQKNRKVWMDQWVNGDVLKAAKQAGRPEEAYNLRGIIEGPPPADKKYVADYWLNRARLEELENHKQDALAYYQAALQARTDPPKVWHGELRDDLSDEAHALWKELGGTESAWAVWSKPPSDSTQQLAEGRWDKPTKGLPSFELADLSGKTWRLKDLNGKAVLINLWATWCGPCNAELPAFEKFYEDTKGRADIQVLTFNIDEDLGLVAPYMKEKGYTFPVLPAYSMVVSLLDGFAIPQNWVVDPHGIWRWRQIGFGGGTNADFAKDMLARLETAKTTP